MISYEDLRDRFKALQFAKNRRQDLKTFLESKGVSKLFLLDSDHYLDAQALVEKWEAEDNARSQIGIPPKSEIFKSRKELVYGKHGALTLTRPNVFNSIFNKGRHVVLTINNEGRHVVLTINNEVVGAKELRDQAAIMLEVAAYLEEGNAG